MVRTALAILLLLAAAPAGAGDRQSNPFYRAGQRAAPQQRELLGHQAPARNAILFIGDGMGLSTVTAARIFEGQQRGEPGEENLLSFERLPHVALIKTWNTDQMVPDSAGTMTAMMCGVKTRAGVLGVDASVVPGDYRSVPASRQPTLFEEAEARGLATGIVTTTRVTHATPAATYAHSASRRWESDADLPEDARQAGFPDIARQLVEFRPGDGIDVVLGGGRREFLGRAGRTGRGAASTGRRRDQRNLLREWQARRPGRRWIRSRQQLLALGSSPVKQVLGLFAADHLAFEADRLRQAPQQPSLSEMTRAALQLLERSGRGFLLVVEAGRIDHAHHANNAYRALVATVELSRAVAAARALTDPEETLIVVTADHSHPLTLAGYARRGNPVLGWVERNDRKGRPAGRARDEKGHPYTLLGYRLGPGFRPASQDSAAAGAGEPDPEDPDYLQRAALPGRRGVHSGEDVPLYAGGPRSALFGGVREQSFVYHALLEALGWNDRTADRELQQGSARQP